MTGESKPHASTKMFNKKSCFLHEWLINQYRDNISDLLNPLLKKESIHIYYSDIYITTIRHNSFKPQEDDISSIIYLDDKYLPSKEEIEFGCFVHGKDIYLGDFRYFYPEIPSGKFDIFITIFIKKIKRLLSL